MPKLHNSGVINGMSGMSVNSQAYRIVQKLKS